MATPEPRSTGFPADRDARLAAIDPAYSCIVQAPAGSGKTELLIQRYLALLGQADAPEEIVAITFTRKAAAEMRGRVLKALREAAGPEPAAAHLRETRHLAAAALERDLRQSWNVQQHPARLRILTIDAFCLSLVRRLPWLSRVGGAPQRVEAAEPLYRQAARQALAVVETRQPAAAAAARLLRHLDADLGRSESLIAGLLARRDQWRRHLQAGDPAQLRASLEAALHRVVNEALQRVWNALQALERAQRGILEELRAVAAYAAGQLHNTGTASPLAACHGLKAVSANHVDRLPEWRGIAHLLQIQSGDWRKPGGFNVRIGMPPGPEGRPMKARLAEVIGAFAGAPDCGPALAALRELPALAYTDSQWRIMEALLSLLPLAVEELREQFRRAGAVDFIGVALGAEFAARARGSEGGVEDRLRHLLVDEFQDTSTSQFRLLSALTAGWTAGNGRTLFLVGDPMQSIYRFREAEVGLFLGAWQAGIGGLELRPLTLRTNFRSGGGIVEWVNRVFPQVLSAVPDVVTGAVAYSPADAVHPTAATPAVQVHPVLAAGGGAAWGAVREAEQVADAAWRVLHERPGESVAVLVRARSHLAEILPALRAVNVPYRAVEIDALAEQPVVLDLLALTRALLYPADRAAWLAVLRGPYCGLSLADLLVLAGEAPGAALWERIQDAAAAAALSTAGRTRLERVRGVLASALAQRERRGLRTWVEGAWLALGGPVGLRPTALDHARAYFGLLEELEGAGVEPTPEELARRLGVLYAAPGAGANAIQVMTIHKAKGLEFDTVMVPGLGRIGRPDSAPLLRWVERPGGAQADLLMAPIQETGSDPDPTYQFLAGLEKAKAGHELRRVLYVAATRAKHRLHWFGVASVTADGVKAPDPRSLLSLLWPAVEAEFQNAQATAQVEKPSVAEPGEPPLLRRLPADWAPPAPPPGVHPALPAQEEEPREPIEFSWAGYTARLVGIAVHRLLVRMAREGAPAWPAARIDAQRPALRTLLAQLGVPEAELDAAAGRAAQALLATLADPRGQWILQRHGEDRSEYDVTAVLDGAVRRLRMDRTFIDEAGRRWIVDYKTGTHEGGRPEEFLDREVERYREAMTRYARVFRALEPERPVRLALYFPLVAGGWREWGFAE